MNMPQSAFHAACFLSATIGRPADISGRGKGHICQWNEDEAWWIQLIWGDEDDDDVPRIGVAPKTETQHKLAREIIGYCSMRNLRWWLD
jgi:hypothetical protein